jgi:hypothetical protein
VEAVETLIGEREGAPLDVGAAADLANDAAVETERESGPASAAAASVTATADLAGGSYGELPTVLEAARDALGARWDEQATRQAIEAALVAWALG